MSFLKFPAARVNALLQHWAEYMKSPEHAKEKFRTQRLDTGNEEAVLEKEGQQKLKMKLHRLRHQRRQMKALHAKTWYSDMSWRQQQLYTKWCSGEMDQELQRLTLAHGYGSLPLDNSLLLPARFPDKVAVHK